jgi:hypothetical protein
LRPEHQDKGGKIAVHGDKLKARLLRKGSVLLVSIPGAPKMSVDETNEWIRKARDREI